jgi:hypothetical protein
MGNAESMKGHMLGRSQIQKKYIIKEKLGQVHTHTHTHTLYLSLSHTHIHTHTQ